MELDLLKKDNLTPDESIFVNLHSKIIMNAKMSGLYLYEFCKELLEMRNSKAYHAAGIKNFEEYAVEVLGLKKSQAYNFCSIAENIKPEIFNLVGDNISSSKLLLVSKLEPEEQEKLILEIDVCNLKYKELENVIENLRTENNTLKSCNDVLQKDNAFLTDKVEDLKIEIESNNHFKYEQEIEKLEKELEAAKKDSLKEDDKKDAEIGQLQEKKIKELEKELEKLKNQEPQIVEKEVVKEIIKQDPLQEEKIKELENQLKKKETLSNESINKFKVIFEMIKKDIVIAKEMISTFKDDDALKCNNALKKLINLI